MVRGACLCGAIGWQSTKPLEQLVHCHCSRCRKSHGSAFATYGAVLADDFQWSLGEGRIRRFESSPGFERPFCADCGSTLPGRPDGEDRVYVPVGSIPDDPVARPVLHIFAASKAPWYEIADDLPRFDEYPAGLEAPLIPELARPGAAEGRAGGSCLCDRVAWEVEGGFDRLYSCHCSRCRRARAAAHATNLFADLERFRWVRGEERIASFALPEAERFTQVFCRDCGAPLPFANRARGRAVVPVGSLDGSPGIPHREHIFVASKAPWFEIRDTAPRHDAYPPDRA